MDQKQKETFAFIFYIVLIAVLAFIGYKMGQKKVNFKDNSNKGTQGAVIGGLVGVLASWGLYELFVKPKKAPKKLGFY